MSVLDIFGLTGSIFFARAGPILTNKSLHFETIYLESERIFRLDNISVTEHLPLSQFCHVIYYL